VSITPKVVSSNHTHGEVYSIQHYVIKFINDLRQVSGFHRVFRFRRPITLIKSNIYVERLFDIEMVILGWYIRFTYNRGGSRGGASTRVRPPPLPPIGKNMIFWRKIVIFHTKYPKFFAPPSVRRNFFKYATPNLKSWIRPCIIKLKIIAEEYDTIFFLVLKGRVLSCPWVPVH
jgi:hypothetical protein